MTRVRVLVDRQERVRKDIPEARLSWALAVIASELPRIEGKIVVLSERGNLVQIERIRP